MSSLHKHPFASRRPALAAALLIAGCAVSTLAAAAPDLTGIWQIQGTIAELKTAQGKAPPLKPEAAKLYAARKAQLKRGDKSFDPTATQCKPPGTPRILYEPFPIEIVQTPAHIYFTYQWNRLYRVVDVDAADTVLAPTYFGTSNAKWRGEMLEIDVQGLHDGTLLDAAGLPHSDALHVIERYQLQDQGKKLSVTLRIEDDQTFTQPWEARIVLNKLATDRLGEDVCEERLGLVKQ